ncbi:hypothetical protein PR048_000443 [Dryococelus australis]|uniref:Uncharacterized protein n=1 Tax=Dryococelus australis TaxID=614101 RepID=A0ABQ9IGY0_9NEOP|nr:hypothetical protein PR048_000443 [Dryococelus australis]
MQIGRPVNSKGGEGREVGVSWMFVDWSNSLGCRWAETSRRDLRDLFFSPSPQRRLVRQAAVWYYGNLGLGLQACAWEVSYDARVAMRIFREAAVAARFACSPSTKANREQFPTGPRPYFRNWESCWTMPLVSRFSCWGYPVSLALAFRRCSILTSLRPYRLSRPQRLAVFLNVRTLGHLGWSVEIETRPVNNFAEFAPEYRPSHGDEHARCVCKKHSRRVTLADISTSSSLMRPRDTLRPVAVICISGSSSARFFEDEHSSRAANLATSSPYLVISEDGLVGNHEGKRKDKPEAAKN